jgi:3-oxoacyl-[acyl-carrier-protein] synthase-3
MLVYLNAISYYLPCRIVTNEDISREHPEWSVEKISSKVGIEERHWAAENETAGDLAYQAAEQLFVEYNISKEDIDYVIFCTQSPDYFLPSTACLLQDKLGLSKHCGAFDFNLGCSGYVYGLGLAKGLISSKQAHSILLLTGETYTKYINPKDKGNKTVFGDAGTATIISSSFMEGGLNFKLEQFSYGTDGAGANNLIVKNGAAKHFAKDGVDFIDEENNFSFNNNNLFMDGKAIFNFTAFKVPEFLKENLFKNNLILEDVDYFIFHQANEYMLNAVRKRCGIPKERFFIDIKNVGNTVSNTLPIAICKANLQGKFNDIHSLLLMGFGVGLSIGAVLLKK